MKGFAPLPSTSAQLDASLPCAAGEDNFCCCLQHIKYGVVETASLCEDLTDWNTLYCAGRLHKPVTHLLPLPAAVAAAQDSNLDAAVATALLLLPAKFSSTDFYKVICGISYMADIRMAFAEDSRKLSSCKNIGGQQQLSTVARTASAHGASQRLLPAACRWTDWCAAVQRGWPACTLSPCSAAG